MSTPQQVAANIQNSKHSTGPMSVKGRLIASQNSRKHGLLSKRLIVSELESAEEWDAHYQEIFESLSPIGGLETKLTERISNIFWRLNRVARYESERLQLIQEKAVELVANRNFVSCSDLSKNESEILNKEEFIQKARWAEFATKALSCFRKFMEAPKEKERPLTEEEAEILVVATCRIEGNFDIPKDSWPPAAEDFTGWRCIDLWCVFEWLATKAGRDLEEFIKELQNVLEGQAKQNKELSLEIERYRRSHLILDERSVELICRYEAHLHRAFQRDLHELQRLQAARQGAYVQPPAVLDVNVTGAESK